MAESIRVSYRIDAADRILTVDDGWVSFAEGNDGDQLLPPGILGSLLWPWIADSTTSQLYRDLIRRVRNGRGPVRFRFRCDAPDERRLLQMQITSANGGEVQFETNLLVSQPRPPVALLDSTAARSREPLTICGWCMRIPDAFGTWLEIEMAIVRLELFEGRALPMLSHGMCPTCCDAMLTVVADPKLAASGDVTVGPLRPT